MNSVSLSDDFKPEDRMSGEKLFKSDCVSISSSSDTQASAYLKASGAPRVSMTSQDIASPHIIADCTCPKAKKGRLCKHIWATILKLESIEADFLSCKSHIEKSAPPPESEQVLAAKARQAEYKQKIKDQNKARNKKLREGKKQIQEAQVLNLPFEVEAALSYFSTNGFEFEHPLQIEDVGAARKSLARIFHPDKGGTHQEILTLNENHDTIAAYIQFN